MADNDDDSCYVLIVGSHRNRLLKVMEHISFRYSTESTLQFIPSLAKFGSYEDENNGKVISYLLSVSAIGKDNDEPRSLAPFFDGLSFRIGALLAASFDETQQEQIRSFLRTLSNNEPTLTIGTVTPGPSYNSWQEELDAYRSLDLAEKERVTQEASMGPAKVALLAFEMGQSILLAEKGKDHQSLTIADEILERPVDDQITRHSPTVDNDDDKKTPTIALPTIDPNERCFACRKCRTILFGQVDLETHQVGQQTFGYHKQSNSLTNASCQSYFLQESLDWMNTNDTQGKLACPKCQTKIGSLDWSGSQCSCGTWVVPALQIPKSRVDTIEPSPPQR